MDQGEDTGVTTRWRSRTISERALRSRARTSGVGSSRQLEGREGSHSRTFALTAIVFPIEDCVWWVSTRHGDEQCNWWCAACGGQYTWRNPNGVLVLQDSTDRREAKVSREHALPQAIGEPAVGRGMTTLCRCLLRVFQIDELQRLIKVDDHEEVNIADLEKYSVALHVVEPKFGREDFPEAAVREGVEELTVRRGEAVGLRTFIDTTNVGG